MEYQRLNSEDDYGYEYGGAVISPEAGLIIHAGRAIDIEAGARGHVIAGTMEQRTPSGTRSAAFSNSENIRGYFRFTLTAPSGAYGQLYFDASPEVGKTIAKGPEEAAIGFSVGVLIRQDREDERLPDEHGRHFPSFRKMKEREERMRKELQE